jgi:hypothetical protein
MKLAIHPSPKVADNLEKTITTRIVFVLSRIQTSIAVRTTDDGQWFLAI